MKKDKVLLVEDDSTLAFIIEDALVREGFEVVAATDGRDGLVLFSGCMPDIVLADIMMPKMDGLEMVKEIRNLSPDIPVIFLTARTSIDDVVRGFETGANDYMRKPFQIVELVMRIKALLRRSNRRQPEDAKIQVGDCVLNVSSQRLIIDKKEVDLSHIEMLILDELFRHKNEVVEARTLMMRIWQNDDFNNLNRLHGFIYKLRKILSVSSSVDILNARGVGYKLASRE